MKKNTNSPKPLKAAKTKNNRIASPFSSPFKSKKTASSSSKPKEEKKQIKFPKTKEGWMHKSGRIRKALKLRFFILGSKSLIYFTDEDKADSFYRDFSRTGELNTSLKYARGAIPLSQAKLVTTIDDESYVDTNFGLSLDNRLYEFICSNPDDCASWISAIEKELGENEDPLSTVTLKVFKEVENNVFKTGQERVRALTQQIVRLPSLVVEEVGEEEIFLFLRQKIRSIMGNTDLVHKDKELTNILQHMKDILNDESYQYLKRRPKIRRQFAEDPLTSYRMIIASMIVKYKDKPKKMEKIIDKFWTTVMDIVEEEAPGILPPDTDL